MFWFKADKCDIIFFTFFFIRMMLLTCKVLFPQFDCMDMCRTKRILSPANYYAYI